MSRHLGGITDAAKAALRAMLADFEAATGNDDAVLAITWIEKDLNPHLSKSGVRIGFYTERKNVEGHIQVVDGIEIVMTIPQDMEGKFDGKLLDFDGSSFVFTGPPCSDSYRAN